MPVGDQRLALRVGDAEEPGHRRPPPAPVASQVDRHRHGRQRRAPVAAVPHRGQRQPADARRAHRAVAVQRAGRADLRVVVQRRHDRHPGVGARVPAPTATAAGTCCARARRPAARAAAGRRASSRAAGFHGTRSGTSALRGNDIVAMSSLRRSNSVHLVPGRAQQRHLLVDDVVLAARLRRSGSGCAPPEPAAWSVIVGPLRSAGARSAARGDGQVQQVRRRVAEPGLGVRGDHAVHDQEDRARRGPATAAAARRRPSSVSRNAADERDARRSPARGRPRASWSRSAARRTTCWSARRRTAAR